MNEILDVLAEVKDELSQSSREIVKSLEEQVETGKPLSEKQTAMCYAIYKKTPSYLFQKIASMASDEYYYQ